MVKISARFGGMEGEGSTVAHLLGWHGEMHTVESIAGMFKQKVKQSKTSFMFSGMKNTYTANSKVSRKHCTLYFFF